MFRYVSILAAPLRLFSLCAILFGGPAAASDLVGPIHVIDGDTLDVGSVRVRLHGIDTPEAQQQCGAGGSGYWACGDWVTRSVREAYEGRTARCEALDTDRYGRTVARCLVDGEDIGQALVRQGLAFAYLKYARDYAADEAQAKAARRGLHAVVVTNPAQFRAKARPAETAPEGCAIKGNISQSKGQRIYHLPGQEHYAATRINLAAGERWFCSEAEAKAAGWLRARH